VCNFSEAFFILDVWIFNQAGNVIKATSLERNHCWKGINCITLLSAAGVQYHGSSDFCLPSNIVASSRTPTPLLLFPVPKISLRLRISPFL